MLTWAVLFALFDGFGNIDRLLPPFVAVAFLAAFVLLRLLIGEDFGIRADERDAWAIADGSDGDSDGGNGNGNGD